MGLTKETPCWIAKSMGDVSWLATANLNVYLPLNVLSAKRRRRLLFPTPTKITRLSIYFEWDTLHIYSIHLGYVESIVDWQSRENVYGMRHMMAKYGFDVFNGGYSMCLTKTKCWCSSHTTSETSHRRNREEKKHNILNGNLFQLLVPYIWNWPGFNGCQLTWNLPYNWPRMNQAIVDYMISSLHVWHSWTRYSVR